MKLILHIGTHKTGTTSLQHFCALNRTKLQTFGIFYPRNRKSAYVFNHLASQIAFNGEAKTRSELEEYVQEAKQAGAHTVIVSGESFYAMTGFFHLIQKKPVADYWGMEEKFVAVFADIVKEIFTNIEIRIFMRPQDDLAASLYNQMVKNTQGYTGSFSDFLSLSRPIYDYARHLALWVAQYGRSNVKATIYGRDTIQDFFTDILTDEQIKSFVGKTYSSNERLNRDVLEFKRVLNERNRNASIADLYMTNKIIMTLNPYFPDKKDYQIFMPLAQRKKYFEDFEEGNSHLAKEFVLQHLPVIQDISEPSYAGLNEHTHEKLDKLLKGTLGKPSHRIERTLRYWARKTEESLPLSRSVINELRSINNNFRLKFRGW